jgi:hypothetical protein
MRTPSEQDIPIPVSSVRFLKPTRKELKDYPSSSSILESELQRLEKSETRHPVDYWRAIKGCVKHQREFPPSVIAYLGRCADRMLSEEAERPRDVRKTLLWIMEFPKKGMGPGSPLDRSDDAFLTVQKRWFAFNFVERLGRFDRGDKLGEARKNAGYDVFGKNKKDKILRQYLREEFGVSELPSTMEEWQPVIGRYLNDVRTGKRAVSLRPQCCKTGVVTFRPPWLNCPALSFRGKGGAETVCEQISH